MYIYIHFLPFFSSPLFSLPQLQGDGDSDPDSPHPGEFVLENVLYQLLYSTVPCYVKPYWSLM